MKILLLGLVALAACSLASAQTTYDIDFTAGGAETIEGTIELPTGTEGQVTEILGYTLGSALGDPVSFSVSGGALGVGDSVFSVSGEDLLFTPLPWVAEGTIAGCTDCCETCDANPIQQTSFSYLTFQGLGHNSFGDDHGTSGPGDAQGVGFTGGGPSLDGQSWYLATGTVLGADPPSGGAAAAPEINPAGALEGLTLLLGGLAVIRGRRRPARDV